MVELVEDNCEEGRGGRVVQKGGGDELALEAPGRTVDVEDAAAEEVREDGGEGFSLGVVVELGLEDVANVGWVGGDDVTEDVEVDGVRRGSCEEVGVPVGEVVEVVCPAAGKVGLADVTVAPPAAAEGDELWAEPEG